MAEYTITREDADRDLRALRGALARFPEAVSSSCIPALRELIDAIEEQTKPAIEEPLAFASVVKVRSGELYVRLGAAQALPWGSGEAMRHWNHLDVVEVLRVGVGEQDDAYGNGVLQGRRVACIMVKLWLQKQLSAAIGAERKDVLEKAIKAVEDLIP